MSFELDRAKRGNVPIIPYRPFGDLERWFEEEWSRLPEISRVLRPSVDVYETDSEVVAELEVPGIDPEKIDVQVKDNVLRVQGGKTEEKEEKKKGYYRKEIRKGYFNRVVALPIEVVGEKTEATYKDGILKVVMPKVKPLKEKEEKGVKIKVKGVKTA